MRAVFHRGIFVLAGALLLLSGVAGASGWKSDFERICAHTLDATSLPSEDMRRLIRETDALMHRIEKIGDRRMKVYTFRLKKCRKFFVYALELKESGKPANAGGK